MITIYQAVREQDLSGSEEAEAIAWFDLPPQLGDPCSMGSSRTWRVMHVEHYHGDGSEVCLALVAPLEVFPSPDRGEWIQTYMREQSPNLSFYVQLAPNKDVLNYGWRMEGDTPIGRLKEYKPTNHPTLMKASPSPWMVDVIDRHRLENGVYTAIDICWCKQVALVAA
jgi:hypothetical protein